MARFALLVLFLGPLLSVAAEGLKNQVCADFENTRIPSFFYLWHDAIFSIPKKYNKQVTLSTTASALLSPICAVEANTWGVLTLFHYLELCGDPEYALELDDAGRKRRLAPRTLLPGQVACIANDDVCYVRAAPYTHTCLELPPVVLQTDTADIDIAKFEFIGFKPSTFGGIDGHQLDDSPSFRPWEGFIAAQPKLRNVWRHPAYIAAGLLVTFSAEPLVENRAFQYLVAALAGDLFFLMLALLVVYLCVSHLVRVSQQTAWGSFLYHSALVLPPVAAFFYKWLVEQLGTFLSLMFGLWSNGSCFLDPSGHCDCSLCYPWLGKAYFGGGALLGLLCEYSWCFFYYPPWRYEEQGWNMGKCGQMHLERFLGLAGLACFWHSFSSADTSMVFTFLLSKSVREQIAHWVFLVYLAERKSPYYAEGGRLQSVEEYESIGQATTEKELAKLRTFVNQEHNRYLSGGLGRSSSVLARANFDEETMRRLDAFRLGGTDARRPNDHYLYRNCSP